MSIFAVVFLILTILLVSYIIYLRAKFSKNLKSIQISLEDLQLFRDKHIGLEAVLQIIQDGVIVADLNNRIKLVSQKAAIILKTEVSKLQEQNIEMVLPIENLKDKFNVDLTTQLTLQNGAVITATIKSLPIVSEQKIQGTVFLIQDKTQEKIFEEMKLDFVAMAAHQLRTPLTFLKGYLSLLADSIANKLTEHERLYLDRSVSGVNKLSTLTEYLINASIVGETKLRLNLKLSSLEQIVSDVITEFKNVSSQKQIIIEFEKPQLPLPQILIDPNLIKTVLDNLIVNAVEHSQSNKISVRIRRGAEAITVEVQDFGKGIPSSALPYLFSKFYKVPQHLVATPGKGLGLYLSKKIVEAHWGRIWVDSILGRGATFSFSLPLPKNQGV